jgi:MFS superfamily sulfate permease-like transporter
VSFLNKGSILQKLNEIPENSKVKIDGTDSKAIDFDVIEIIKDFQINAKNKNIEVTTEGIKIETEA